MYGSIITYVLNRIEPPKLLKDRFTLSASSLVFEPHHFLFEIFDRKLQQYIEGDLIGYNKRFWDETSNPKKYEKRQESFAVLKLGDLEAGFIVCLVPLVLSILVFAIEKMPIWKKFVIF